MNNKYNYTVATILMGFILIIIIQLQPLTNNISDINIMNDYNDKLTRVENQYTNLDTFQKNLNTTIQEIKEQQTILLNKIQGLNPELQSTNSVTTNTSDNQTTDSLTTELPTLENVRTEYDEQLEIENSKKHHQQLNDTLVMEGFDSLWNDQVVKQLTSSISKKKFADSTLANSECKETLCKITIHHTDSESADDFNISFHDTLNWDGEVEAYTSADDSGKLVTTLFLHRTTEDPNFENIENQNNWDSTATDQ